EPQPPSWIPRPLSTDQPSPPADAPPWLSHGADTIPSHTRPPGAQPTNEPATQSRRSESLSDPMSPVSEPTTPTWFPRTSPAQPPSPSTPDQPAASTSFIPGQPGPDTSAPEGTTDSGSTPRPSQTPTSPWLVPMPSGQHQQASRPRPVVRPAEMQLRARTHRPAH